MGHQRQTIFLWTHLFVDSGLCHSSQKTGHEIQGILQAPQRFLHVSPVMSSSMVQASPMTLSRSPPTLQCPMTLSIFPASPACPSQWTRSQTPVWLQRTPPTLLWVSRQARYPSSLRAGPPQSFCQQLAGRVRKVACSWLPCKAPKAYLKSCQRRCAGFGNLT